MEKKQRFGKIVSMVADAKALNFTKEEKKRLKNGELSHKLRVVCFSQKVANQTESEEPQRRLQPELDETGSIVLA